MSYSLPKPSKLLLLSIAVIVLIVLLLYMQGSFVGKVSPGQTALPGGAVDNVAIAAVERRRVEDRLSWPGAVHAKSVANIAPKLTARIVDITVHAGDKVGKGDVLAKLDERDVQAQIHAAEALAAGAVAEAERAKADGQRLRQLFAKEAATRASLDAAVAQEKAALSRVGQATASIREIRAHLDDTVLRAPFSGVVVKRLQEPGDMAMPGVPVVSLQMPQDLRLEAWVPDFCAAGLSTGAAATVYLENRSQGVSGQIAEIAPELDPITRSQLVKIALPPLPGLRPGQFGRLELGCGEHEALLIPVTAVRHVGQLESVQVVSEGKTQSRHVRTGKSHGDSIEVLSGLRAGEKLLANPGETR